MIETRLLNYFLAIAREQSITKAAETLHITQPTLSKQIMELEQKLGKQLLIRGKKKITLTEEGIYFRSRAQEMIQIMEKTEATFQIGDDMISGDIYMGCGETPSMKYITEVFHKIHLDYPHVHLHIFSGDADAVLERLDKGLLDIGLLLGPIQHEKYNYIKLSLADTYGLLMPKDCTLAKKKAVTIEDVMVLPLIFPQQPYNSKQNIEWIHADYESLNIVATYNLLYNATFSVEQGLGYAFCLGNLIDTNSSRNLTFRPFDPPLHLELYLVTKRYQTFSSAVKLFLERLKEDLCT